MQRENGLPKHMGNNKDKLVSEFFEVWTNQVFVIEAQT